MTATLDLEGHTNIAGRTSSGKTWFVRKAIFAKTKKRVVFFNTQREPEFGPEIMRWDRRLLTLPASRVNLVAPRPSANENNRRQAVALLARVVDDLIEVGEKAGTTDRKGRVLLIVDEAHYISPKHSSDDPLQVVSTNGHRYGIKLVTITQRPAKLSHTVLSQASSHILFDLDDYERGYMDEYAVPDEVRRWIRDPLPGHAPGTPNRRFALRAGTVWHRCAPI